MIPSVPEITVKCHFFIFLNTTANPKAEQYKLLSFDVHWANSSTMRAIIPNQDAT